jgi:Sec-independent protein translocase protein TatA
MVPSHVALIGMPSWLELGVIGLVVLLVIGPKLLDLLARLSVERERFR